MRAVRSKGTKPERLVYSWLSAHCRYTLQSNRADLPGRPDIVLPGAAVAIFVHGCFWHGHTCSRGGRLPKTNREYWSRKIARNRRRDRKAAADLREMGYRVFHLWECKLGRERHGYLSRMLGRIRKGRSGS